MRPHILLNFRICIPLLAIYLVAPNMKKLVGEKLGHFTDELVQEFVSALTRWVHCGIENTPLPLDRIRPGTAGQIRISHEPGSAVPRHIEFGHNANAAIASVRNDVTH